MTNPQMVMLARYALTKAINEAFNRAYPGSMAVEDELSLVKRVKMLSDDLHCTRINWHTMCRAYSKLDHEKRSIRWHWWQFWRKPRP